MNNHLGAVTRIEYAPSTRFQLEDAAAVATRWRTALPVPVHVVGRVDVEDEWSGGHLTTRYRYRHGYWDGTDREFRGFGLVEQYDAETITGHGAGRARHVSPPKLTRTWFHQGPVDDGAGGWAEPDPSAECWPGDPSHFPELPGMTEWRDGFRDAPAPVRRAAVRALRGQILRTEVYALDGSPREDRPCTVTEQAHGAREESPPAAGDGDRGRVFFPYLVARRTTQWERGDDPMTELHFIDDFDEYGLPRRETRIACPRG